MEKETRRELENKLALLESVNDQLVTELTNLNELMLSLGFSHGLESVKAVAEEILSGRLEQKEEC